MTQQEVNLELPVHLIATNAAAEHGYCGEERRREGGDERAVRYTDKRNDPIKDGRRVSDTAGVCESFLSSSPTSLYFLPSFSPGS